MPPTNFIIHSLQGLLVMGYYNHPVIQSHYTYKNNDWKPDISRKLNNVFYMAIDVKHSISF